MLSKVTNLVRRRRLQHGQNWVCYHTSATSFAFAFAMGCPFASISGVQTRSCGQLRAFINADMFDIHICPSGLWEQTARAHVHTGGKRSCLTDNSLAKLSWK